MMDSADNQAFRVGDWQVEPSLNQIRRASERTVLRPQVMDLLVYLARHEGRVVSADELLENLWPGKVVTDSTLYNCVAELRHALSGGDASRQYVETVTKKGYRLRAPVTGLINSESRQLTLSSISPFRSGFNASIAIAGVALLVVVAFSLQPRSTVSGPGTLMGGELENRPLQLPLQLPHYADSSKNYGWAAPTLSPDGRQIAYVGSDGSDVFLYLKNAADNRARRIANTEGAAAPAFSPNGKWIAYFAKGKLMRIATDGGQPVEIGEINGVPLGASWGDDDSIVFSVGYRSHLRRIHSAGGAAEALTSLGEGDVTHRFPHVLPGARAALYQNGSDPSVMQLDAAGVWILDLKNGKNRFLLHGNEPKFAQGRMTFLRAENPGFSLWSVPFDLDTLTVTGIETPHRTAPIQSYDLSRSGALIHASPRRVIGTRLSIVEGHRREEIFNSKESINHPRFSPDGTLLIASVGKIHQSDVWMFDLANRTAPTKLTSHNATNPIWSTKGDSIAYAVLHVGILTKSIARNANPSLLIPLEQTAFPIQWTYDGLLYGEINAETNGDLFMAYGDGEKIAVDADEAVTITGTISPDGSLLAYSRKEWSRPEIYVREYPGGQQSWKITQYGGDKPKWSADGSTIFFETVNRLKSVHIVSRDPIAFGDIQDELAFSGNSSMVIDPYDVFGNGEKFAVVEREYGESPEFTYVDDWL